MLGEEGQNCLLPQIRNWRNVLGIVLVLTGLYSVHAWGQISAVGPVRYSISPGSPQPIPNGKSLKLTVLETYFRNGSQATGVRDVSSRVTWTSSDSNTISVSSHGLAIAKKASGSVNITATIQGIGSSGQLSIMLTAAPAVLSFISVNNFNSSVTVTGTIAYTATQHYSDGSTPPFSSPVAWGVVNNVAGSGQATIISTSNNMGTATGTMAGVVKITATFGGVTGATYLNVGLTGISISPLSPTTNPPSVPKGELQTFSATGTFSAGGPLDITNYGRWSSATSSVAGITNASAACTSSCVNGGIAFTRATGTTDITAISGSITSNIVTLTVTPAVVTSIGIAPSGSCSPSNVPRGNSCQFSALAIYSDQTTASFTDVAAWNPSSGTCASVSSTGLATTLSTAPNPCNTNVTATYTNINPPNNLVTSNVITLTVTTHVLNSISISPKTPTQPKGTPQQFTVKGHYTDGIFSIPNGGANGPVWSSSNTSVATIGSSSGLSSTTNSVTGTTNIGATYNNLQASTVFTVTSAALSSITVTAVGRVPLNPDDGSTTIPIAGTQQFMATGNYTDNSHQDITEIVNWTSSDQTVATINDPNSVGEATGIAAGTLTNGITATEPNSNVSGSASLTVRAVNSITVNPASANINPGAMQPFTATANYTGPSATQPLAAFGPTWFSNHTNVATVDQNGNATAIAAGAATITATMGSVSCTGINCGALTVNAAVLQSITVSCDPNNPCTGSGEPVLSLGQTEQMIATGHYSDGSNQDLTQKATWASIKTSVATIDPVTGFLTTQGLGSTDITATCTSGGGCPGATSTVTGTMTLTVTF